MTVALKMYAIYSYVRSIRILGLTKKYSYVFEWNVKATQILNLQSEPYKIGIQASPYLCFISFLYLDLYVLRGDAWIR